jgi:hypothetical protein
MGKKQTVYMVAEVRIDPCEYVLSSLSTVAAWEGSPVSAAEEAIGMVSGVTLRCSCGNTQPACLRDASIVSSTVEDFNRNLKPRDIVAGPKRLTAYEKQKLRKVLLKALREVADLDGNRQVCSQCGKVYLLSYSN